MHHRAVDCIAEDSLEGYSRKQLSGAELAAVEEHLLLCERCQERLQETDAFLDATRRALQGFDAPKVPY